MPPRWVAIAAVALAPVLAAPSCAGTSDQPQTDPDSKRWVRKSGDPHLALILSRGEKTVPVPGTGGCLTVPSSAGQAPMTVLDEHCRDDSPTPGAPVVELHRGGRLRVLTGAEADVVLLFPLSGGPPLSGKRADKAGHRWDFRLRGPTPPGVVRMEVRVDGVRVGRSAAETVPIAYLDFAIG
jgi:hypothetical protein